MKIEKRQIAQQEKGFSLIELVVVVTILGMIIGIAYGVILLNARTFGTLSGSIETQWEVRKAMNIMRKDFQNLDPQKIIGFFLGGGGHGHGFGHGHGHHWGHGGGSILSSKRIYFFNNKGILIKYVWVNHFLMRKEGGGPWSVLLNNVEEAPFFLFDQAMNGAASKDKVRYIGVHLAVLDGNKKKVISDDIFYLRNAPAVAP